MRRFVWGCRPAVVIVLALCGALASAQGPRTSSPDSSRARRALVLLARNTPDSVVLRWAPTDPAHWILANRSGYRVIRYTIRSMPPDTNGYLELTHAPVRPWPLAAWQRRIGRKDTLAAIAAQVLHGKQFSARSRQSPGLAQIMDKSVELQDRYGFAMLVADLSPLAADGLGLRWVDRTAEPNGVYLYLVICAVDSAAGVADTAAVVVRRSHVDAIPPVGSVEAEGLDRMVRLTWPRGLHAFSAYYLERSADGGTSFRRTTKLPIASSGGGKLWESGRMEAVDSLPGNYTEYLYRVRGITAFGELSEPSPPVAVTGRDLTPPHPPSRVSAENTVGREVRIRWGRPKDADLQGYIVGRGDSVKGPFQPLFDRALPPTQTEYIDSGAVAWGTNFYVVAALDTAGNASASLPVYAVIRDNSPPAPPGGLRGTIDSTGVVRVTWDLGDEPDLLGYMVYTANSRTHIFSPCTREFVGDTTFVDSLSLRTLTRRRFYFVRAFDRNNNPSLPSDTIEVLKPDRIRPVAPVFIGFLVTDTAVYLRWAPSGSEDVDRQVLLRRESGGLWAPIAQLPPRQREYVDREVGSGRTYLYGVQAVDSAGLRSDTSYPVTARVYDGGRNLAVREARASYHPGEHAVVLEWNPSPVDGARVVIYRSSAGSGLRLYAASPAAKGSFHDSDVARTGVYEYVLKTVGPDGAESPLSKKLTVEVGN